MNPNQMFKVPLTKALAFVVLSFLAACKSPQESGTNAAQPNTTATSKLTPQNSNQPQTRPALSATQWLTKANISAEEARTVDALLKTIADFGGPRDNPVAAAKWAERNMQIAALSDEDLSEIAPILVFKRIVTLTITGNKFTQAQLNELLAGLPNLKTLVKDKHLKCDNIKYPKVVCLE